MILRSIRTFPEIKVKVWSFSDFNMMRLSEIFSKFSKDIKKITFEFAAIDEKLLIKLLNLLPELEDITVDVSLYSKIVETSNFKRKLCILSKMKHFSCNAESAKLILELPNNTLIKLSFISSLHNLPPSQELLRSVFNSQKKIEDLNFDPQNLEHETMNLKGLKILRLATNNLLPDILNTHDKISCLNTVQPLTDGDFLSISNLKFLQQLCLNVTKLDFFAVLDLKNLTTLKELTINIDLISQGPTFKDLKLPEIEKIKLSYSENTNIEERIFVIAEHFPLNFPKLKHLEMGKVSTKILSILLNNTNLESLQLSEISYSTNVRLHLTPKHYNLKELSLGSVDNAKNQVLNLIFSCLPNLQKLKLGNISFSDVELFKIYIKKCKRLTHLCILSANFSIFDVPVQQFLKQHGQSLKYVELSKSNYSNINVKDVTQSNKVRSLFKCQFSSICENGETVIMSNCKWEK